MFRVQNCYVGSISQGTIVYVLPPLKSEIEDKNADVPHAIAQVQRVHHSIGRVDIFWLTDGIKESNSKGTFTNGWLLDRIRPIKNCLDIPDLCGLLNKTSPWSRSYMIFDLMLVVEWKGDVHFLTWWKGFSIDECSWLAECEVQESLQINTEEFCSMYNIPCVVADKQREFQKIKDDFVKDFKAKLANEIPEFSSQSNSQKKKKRRKEERKEFFGHIDKNFPLLTSNLECYMSSLAAEGLIDENEMYEVPELPLAIPEAVGNGYVILFFFTFLEIESFQWWTIC